MKIGDKYGRLVAVRIVGINKWRNRIWLFKCDCGKEIELPYSKVKCGHTKSCGCLRVETTKRLKTKHGLRQTRFYKIWAGVKKRCENPKYKDYPNYGGRGIRLSIEWLTFENFYNDMFFTYSEHVKKYGEKNTTIERKNVNGNYDKDNCDWATKLEQARNTRANRLLTFEGETLCVTQWAERFSMTRQKIEKRLKRGWSVEEALTQ